MIDDSKKTDWFKHCPVLNSIEDKAWRDAIAKSRIQHYAPGDEIFREGEACSEFFVIVEGRVRLQHINDAGHEIAIEHLGEGQACRLNLSCVLGGDRQQADAIAERATRVVFIPAKAFNTAVSSSNKLRQYVFNTLDHALNDLVTLVDEVAFDEMDRRLAKRLLALSMETPQVMVTHQEIANELGTAREVISRLLKQFTTRGWIHCKRGHIDILDREALKALATTAGRSTL